MLGLTSQEIYRTVLKNYPDVLDVGHVSEILSVSKKTVYKLIRSGELCCLRVGREYRIPKVILMQRMKMIHSAK